jgi:hypothetical protein
MNNTTSEYPLLERWVRAELIFLTQTIANIRCIKVYLSQRKNEQEQWEYKTAASSPYSYNSHSPLSTAHNFSCLKKNAKWERRRLQLVASVCHLGGGGGQTISE